MIEAANPGLQVELVPIVTEGDRRPGDLSLDGGKGLFTQELEAGLRDGSLDLAVHSLKDLPVAGEDDLAVAAFPPRADPRDVLVSETAADLAGLPDGSVLLTSSSRRRSQILATRPDIRVNPLRGNVETRILKWRTGSSAGMVIAAAGLERLAITDLPSHPLDLTEMIPAPGQGTLAVQVRRDSRADPICRTIDDDEAREQAAVERAVVTALGGDCTLPLGVFARREGPAIRVDAFLGDPGGKATIRVCVNAPAAAEAAAICVERMRAAGADAILGRP